MDGAEIGAEVNDAMQAYGEDLVLRRPGDPDVDVNLNGRRLGASDNEAGQGQITSRFRVRIGAGEIAAQATYTLPVLPDRDQIIDGDGRAYVIRSVDTKRVGAVVVAHVLTVEG